jgi:3-deoxy-D-manno-octulosonic-acid transferase
MATGGLTLNAYLHASRAIPLFAPFLLRRRLVRGKEDPMRWREKLGEPTLSRPDGALIWLHAVGLGEVLALRGLIAQMAELAPYVSFLVTSTARSSAAVFAANLPPRCQHQFLPLDAPSYVARFLGHWRPDMSIWAEQEVWPGMAAAAFARGVPLALVNARLTAKSYRRRLRVRGLYAEILSRFSLVSAQDEGTAGLLKVLGAGNVRIEGDFKAAAPPLSVDDVELNRLRQALLGRRVWVAASTHPGDEAEAIVGAEVLSDRLLILVPRDIGRADAISATLTARGVQHLRRSMGGIPVSGDRVWIADSYGELGLWYRLAEVALVGGGFDKIGGHNPWEAAALGAAIIHGPDVTNFQTDYAQLHRLDAARPISSGGLAASLAAPDLATVASRAMNLVLAARGNLAPLAHDLLALLPRQTV